MTTVSNKTLADEPEVYRDAPVSLQCIGRKGEDEAIVRMTEILAAALKANQA